MPPKNSKPNENELKDLLSFYQKKQFFNAEKLALSLTIKYPRHSFAWKIFAAVLEQTDRMTQALEINKKVVFLFNSDPEAHLSLGNCYNRLGKLEDAELSYKKALLLKPNYIQALNNLAIILNKLKHYKESLFYFKKIITLQPDFAEAYNYLGLNLASLERFDEAVLYFKKAINLKPDNYHAYSNLGNTLVKVGQFEEAISVCQKGINIKPDFSKLYFNLGNAQRELGLYQHAISNLKTAIKLKHDYVDAHYNLGITLTLSGHIEEAVKFYNQAIALSPNFVMAYNNLGNALSSLGKIEDAISAYKKSIILDPDFFTAYSNLGIALKSLGRFQESYDSFQKAVDIKPDYAEGYHNWGRALMLNFDFQKAFELMEWRLKLDKKDFIPLNTSKPRWDGLTKHKVFVWKEQGIGDYIMFSSMISELHANAKKVIVECDPRLLHLFQRSFSNEIRFITDRAEISEDDYDSHLPIGSLPLHFRKELNVFKKSSKGWLQADPVRVKNIRKNFIKSEKQKIVGISWKTSSIIANANLRNIHIEKFLNPFKKFDLKFINLQYGDVSEELSNLKVNLGINVLEIPDLDLFFDIDGLAATIAACDFVMTIDNLNPHLAGALNIRTKLLLPYVADERWGYNKNKSYWHDSITIYRQREPGNWNDPILSASNNLNNFINN